MTAISTATKFLTNIHRLRTKHLLQLMFRNVDSRGWNCRDRPTHAWFSVSFWCVIHLRSQLRLGRDGRTFAYSIGWKKWMLFACSSQLNEKEEDKILRQKRI